MPANSQPRRYPSANNLLGHVRWLTDLAYGNQEAIRATRQQALTPAQANALFGPDALRPKLLAGGSHSLSIEGMPGQAAEPQLADIPFRVGKLANIPPGFGTSDAGEVYLAYDVGHFFEWTGAAWSMVDGAGYGVFAPASPIPTAFWAAVPTGGGTVHITKQDGSGTTSVSFPAYSLSGYTLYVRL